LLFRKFCHLELGGDVPDATTIGRFRQKLVEHDLWEVLLVEVTRKKNRLYRYYVSQTVLKHGAGTCPVGRVPAGEIETAVIDQLRAVFRQPEIIIATWKATKPHDVGITEAEAREALTNFDPLWDELFPAEQARIIQLLLERVDIGLGGLDVRLRIDGLGNLVRELITNVGKAA
jgi:site-specific DNA recombinase